MKLFCHFVKVVCCYVHIFVSFCFYHFYTLFFSHLCGFVFDCLTYRRLDNFLLRLNLSHFLLGLKLIYFLLWLKLRLWLWLREWIKRYSLLVYFFRSLYFIIVFDDNFQLIILLIKQLILAIKETFINL